MKNSAIENATPKRIQHGNTIYPFAEMHNVGDSFIVKDKSKSKKLSKAKRSSISAAVKNYNNKNGTSIKVSTTLTEAGLMVKRIG